MGVEDSPSTVEGYAGCRMIVFPAADADAEDEAARRHPVQGGDLFGQQRGGPQRSEQHLGLQPDPSGGTGQHGEGGQRFRIFVGQPIQQSHRGEPVLLREPGPFEQPGGVVDGQAEAEFHERSPPKAGSND